MIRHSRRMSSILWNDLWRRKSCNLGFINTEGRKRFKAYKVENSEALKFEFYWRKLKQRLREEGNDTVTNCHGLKLKAYVHQRP